LDEEGLVINISTGFHIEVPHVKYGELYYMDDGSSSFDVRTVRIK
jgi:hypothetical protein